MADNNQGYKANIISTIVDAKTASSSGHGYKANIISTIVDSIRISGSVSGL